ncbi:hypothetical protein [Mucilaginibacter gotjawali]|uniref:Uncharacterized protein n=1 Tax=Mucilaginibacter gotjawali TaxID=1550579 RepID=A0A839SMM8_9SPHI|nr:hypothetical protein [Mucilaginibacter gotjawali]MBB3057749.1 hypothetical protein [Mucilaginibacter gotjawali]
MYFLPTRRPPGADEKIKSAFHRNAWSVEIDQKTHFRSIGTFGSRRINNGKAIFAPIFMGKLKLPGDYAGTEKHANKYTEIEFIAERQRFQFERYESAAAL